MQETNFGLQDHLDGLYAQLPRLLPADTVSMEALARWQETTRPMVIDLLGLKGRESIPPRVQRIRSTDRGRYIEEKWWLAAGEGVIVPMYLLIPKASPPFRPVMAFHGHDPSIEYILGNCDNSALARDIAARDGDYARRLAEDGYFVCAIEQRGFGERMTKMTKGGPFPRSCRHLSFQYMLQGRVLLGERCWDAMQAINYLETRKDITTNSLGCVGFSAGGTTTLWLSAIDERITAAVAACSFSSFKASIVDQMHCECNYVPQVLGSVEMGDLAALIAPRALRIIAGETDDLFPFAPAQKEFEVVQRAYQALGFTDRCSLVSHPGGHVNNYDAANRWLARFL